ncbi:glycosyltransferase family 4 protein [Flavobacteriaceae bacterium S0825]|uniref:glycosyltransferase family 4 protein n=1 Tax=Gaetbulibacter sp. S0825 TaxID=2720084 RepID=UPI001430C059|nr:glycosyltransferase family 4 protein [Gaetbulibacter sp. S0825]MCK0109704.1 glycosyltransferase family 4 protein [Flavobacteriaceae bacterium S0825]NIX65336.1 glycosyltransferase family 4 protein [Gaetbulibacter sp. S0825]
MKKILRITTVPISLRNLLKGQPKFMSQYYEVVGITSSGEEIKDVVNDEGIRVIEVEMTRTISPIKDLVSLWKLYKVIKKEKPFIVHSHTPKAGTLGMMAAKLAGVPNRLHTIAGLPLLVATGAKRKLLDFVEKITYACATKIYPNSLGLKDIIIQNGYTKPSKLKVIANGSSNGIDVNHFSVENISEETKTTLREELNIIEDDTVFVFVGRLVTDKGINELISAFKKLSADHQNIKLLLVGTFESELDPLQDSTLNEIESNNNIINVGWQTDVRPYFAISNVLAFPSYREGFPNVVMQAGAMELPSIVTNINGCNEIIKEGVNGLIIPPKDENELYLAMLNIIENPSKQKELANASRKMICDNYQRQVIWEALLQEYRDLENN